MAISCWWRASAGNGSASVAAENRVTLHELAADEADPSLEDVFLQLTTDELTRTAA